MIQTWYTLWMHSALAWAHGGGLGASSFCNKIEQKNCVCQCVYGSKTYYSVSCLYFFKVRIQKPEFLKYIPGSAVFLILLMESNYLFLCIFRGVCVRERAPVYILISSFHPQPHTFGWCRWKVCIAMKLLLFNWHEKQMYEFKYAKNCWNSASHIWLINLSLIQDAKPLWHT